MTTQKYQIRKNTLLSEKLSIFLQAHPKTAIKFGNVSYVIFSKNDTKLNRMNSFLIKNLIKEGRDVMKATIENNKSNSWQFTPVTS